MFFLSTPDTYHESAVPHTGYWLRLLFPTPHKIDHFGDVPQANLLAWHGKTKLN